MAFIFALSSQSSLPSLYEFTGADKLIHVVAYAPLGLLIAFALSRSVPKGNLLFLTSILALFYGLTDEFHHYFVPGRSASGLDLMADGFGALIGGSIFTFFRETDKAPLVRPLVNEGIFRSLGEGEFASEGVARRSAVEGATVLKSWGSTRMRSSAEVGKTNETDNTTQ